jgi:cyclophilin family peptidyl-prolyl cis-trans isomerase
MRRLTWTAAALALVIASHAEGQSAQTGGARRTAPASPRPVVPAVQKSPGAGPVIVLDTSKGVIQFETYPKEAPKTVEHIVGLVKRDFYNGQRIHRVVKDFVVQFGDPQSRDVTKRDRWGTGGSGRAIGVAEINTVHTHKLGAVAMAHAGNAAQADSQMYITLAAVPRLDSGYTVFGQVLSGMDVVQKLEVGDMIRRATVKAETPPAK